MRVGVLVYRVSMNKKHFLILLLPFFISSFLTALETVFTFEPLKPNERLAYQMGDEKGWILNLYAQGEMVDYCFS